MLVIVGALVQESFAQREPNAYYPPACGIFAILQHLP
ncbi:hypothetical protein KYG_10540 [Acidovorax sp. NO-1]|jgi:hypothetical protein|nr:hypothetical protein KYG_10540 [Acidovorax sp. NO-1]